jgi:hypothetical protein
MALMLCILSMQLSKHLGCQRALNNLKHYSLLSQPIFSWDVFLWWALESFQLLKPFPIICRVLTLFLWTFKDQSHLWKLQFYQFQCSSIWLHHLSSWRRNQWFLYQGLPYSFCYNQDSALAMSIDINNFLNRQKSKQRSEQWMFCKYATHQFQYKSSLWTMIF